MAGGRSKSTAAARASRLTNNEAGVGKTANLAFSLPAVSASKNPQRSRGRKDQQAARSRFRSTTLTLASWRPGTSAGSWRLMSC